MFMGVGDVVGKFLVGFVMGDECCFEWGWVWVFDDGLFVGGGVEGGDCG